MAPESVPADRDGFRRLFDAHRDVVFRMLCRLARDSHHAEDLLQECFATLWRKRDQFRGEGSLEGYVRRIAFRTYLNARPRLERERRALGAAPGAHARDGDPAEAVEAHLDRATALARVRRAVDKLPDSQREPFVLFRYEGLSCAEVAHVLGVSRKAVELRLARALETVASRVRAVNGVVNSDDAPRPASGGSSEMARRA